MYPINSRVERHDVISVWALRVGQVLVSAFAPCRFVLSTMALGAPPAAKRALATIIVAVAAVYKVALPLTRDSADDVVLKSVNQVLLKTHPDQVGECDTPSVCAERTLNSR